MTKNTSSSKQAFVPFFHTTAGMTANQAPLRIVWGHGWGQSHAAFNGLIEALQGQAHHVAVDFHGFGQSPLPPTIWGTADYADNLAAWLAQQPFHGQTIWVGHSFGGRVGLQLAARHPDMLNGLFIIAGAGLPPQRSMVKNLYIKSKIYTFKALKHFWNLLGWNVDNLRQTFGGSGSRDYQNAGPLREVFVRVVQEDLTEVAKQVTCPTFLLYGDADTETPPNIGTRLNALIAGANLLVLEGQDHYSVLSGGRHQTLKHLQAFIKRITA